jgi:predicted MPP superfamily phosphohydrolase
VASGWRENVDIAAFASRFRQSEKLEPTAEHNTKRQTIFLCLQKKRMALVYVHLSDIHFGQEKGGRIVTNNDVKAQLLRDARDTIQLTRNKKADGIIVSGDIAYSGNKSEYDSAGSWLDQLAAEVKCAKTAVQLVPGNHDIDMKAISPAAQTVIDEISKGGDSTLDKYLVSEDDRNLLYRRFSQYRDFAAAYDCTIDGEGTILGDYYKEISPGKYLKFHKMNTALLCSANKNEQGSLLLGERQRTIPQRENVEVIVIAHHPLNWLQDREDTLRYIRSRARMFISGHEHSPSHNCEEIDENSNLLSIAAGATIPPTISDNYTYCYNIIEFSLDNNNNLAVIVYPRMWDDNIKRFIGDTKHYKQDKCTFTLKCPNFRAKSTHICAEGSVNFSKENEQLKIHPQNKVDSNPKIDMPTELEQTLLLRFFRELSEDRRLSVLVELGAIPSGISNKITHSIESIALRTLFKANRHYELLEKINQTSEK